MCQAVLELDVADTYESKVACENKRNLARENSRNEYDELNLSAISEIKWFVMVINVGVIVIAQCTHWNKSYTAYPSRGDEPVSGQWPSFLLLLLF